MAGDDVVTVEEIDTDDIPQVSYVPSVFYLVYLLLGYFSPRHLNTDQFKGILIVFMSC